MSRARPKSRPVSCERNPFDLSGVPCQSNPRLLTIGDFMHRRFLAFFLVLVVYLPSWTKLKAAETKDTDYFPLAVGNRWVFESSEGSAEEPALESWETIRREGTAFIVRIKQPFITIEGIEEQFVVEADGVKHQVWASRHSESQLILKFPLPASGSRWQSGDGIYAVTATGETVTVPAGTFPNCVEVTRWNKATKVIVISTYAPGVGLIRREETFPVFGALGGDFNSVARGRAVLQLKEWSVKTEKPKINGAS